MQNKKDREQAWKCVICGGKFTGWGNNAEPVKSGRCCDLCNSSVVIPMRIAALHNDKNAI